MSGKILVEYLKNIFQSQNKRQVRIENIFQLGILSKETSSSSDEFQLDFSSTSRAIKVLSQAKMGHPNFHQADNTDNMYVKK